MTTSNIASESHEGQTSHEEDIGIWPRYEANQDVVFDQWDALAEREGHAAYAKNEVLPDGAEKLALTRHRFCTWAYNTIDAHEMDRTIVSIALTNFDRLVTNGFIEKRDWILASMTCFYLAIKTYSYADKKYDAKGIAEESNGFIKEEDILDMEHHICQVFDWYLNPPVADMYIDIITNLLLNDSIWYQVSSEEQCTIHVEQEIREQLVAQSKFMCELSVMDTFFSDKDPSSIAYASILVALDLMRFPAGASKWFTSLPLDHDPEETNVCMQRLHEICSIREYEPSKMFHDCNYDQLVDKDTTCKQEFAVRTVTPIKEDVEPSCLKRDHHDMLIESICGGRNEEVVVASPKKRRVQ